MSQRNHSSVSVPEESAFLPLDDEQQVELIERIKEQAEQQARGVRWMFSTLYGFMTFLFVLCFARIYLTQEHVLPFEEGTKHALPISSWMVFYGTSAVIFGICSGSLYNVRLYSKQYSKLFLNSSR